MATDTSELKIDIEEPKSWTRRLTITVPAGRVQRARDEVARRLRDRVRLPGFRKGRIPAQVVERKFGAAIRSEALERVVDAAYREALQTKGLEPISQASVDEMDYQDGTDLTFKVQFEVRPEVQLERLGGFRVERNAQAVTEDDVERILQRLRAENATFTPAEEGQPTAGDRVAVEITPVREEPEAAEPEPRRYELALGEGEAIPDVESAIQTLGVGEDREFVISIPGDAGGEEPEQQKVRIKLLELQRAELPELDDAFAKKLGEAFETVDALRERIREDLQREADGETEAGIRRQLVDAVIEANPFDVPDVMVDEYLGQLLPDRKGMDAERLAEMRQTARPAAERGIKRSLVLDRVAEQEGLRPTADEVDARVEEIAERNGRPVNEVWAQLQRSGRLQSLEGEVLEEKVFAFLKSKSEIVG